MASNTNRFGLLKKDPVADGLDTFNIKTMLNDNWDKIDQNAETIQGAQDKADAAKTAAISAAATDASTKAATAEQNAKDASIPRTEKGAPNGIATLGTDGELSQKPFIFGTYIGNGAPSQFINLGFTPTAVFVIGDDGEVATIDSSKRWDGGLALIGNPVLTGITQGEDNSGNPISVNQKVLEIVTNGFNVFYTHYKQDQTYVYTNTISTNSGKHYYIIFK